MGDTMSTLKSNSINKRSSISTGGTDSFGVIDPVQYFKRLNSIISRRISIYFVIFPVIALFIYNSVITITNWESMNSPCVNEHMLLTEEEFLMRLSNSTFKAQVKDIAINTFCIENVLFFDAHRDLMNMVIEEQMENDNYTYLMYSQRLSLVLIVFPLAFLIIYNIIITISMKDEMNRACVNEHKKVGSSKFYLNLFIVVTSLYVLYQAYYKQKWDVEIKAEYTIFTITLTICLIVMQLTVNELLGNSMLKYRMYIFQVFTIVLHIISVVEPLIKVWVSNRRQSNKKEIATNTFCIENVLFFEAHRDLMNLVISYYSKKSNVPSTDTAYIYSDVLHKNTINPNLQKPFDNIFKPQYEQVYNLYIKEGGIASINIKYGTIKNIEEQMENDNFTFLMFSQAAEEIGDLLYNNIYPRIKGF
ncbi:hypothetical protein PIROE2DRAFT_57577 [Piromyces sp. E2]|nr:hypothetical protein PIROE2DRAFT_57577 [Piromyces sp. E2]|eukprot:OUM69210.1 hypothetical protein PIROE2DRAFT_57577 [Piromyces sp. E2]